MADDRRDADWSGQQRRVWRLFRFYGSLLQPERELAFQHALQTAARLADGRQCADGNFGRDVSHLRAGHADAERNPHAEDKKGRDQELLGRVSTDIGGQRDERSIGAMGLRESEFSGNAAIGYDADQFGDDGRAVDDRAEFLRFSGSDQNNSRRKRRNDTGESGCESGVQRRRDDPDTDSEYYAYAKLQLCAVSDDYQQRSGGRNGIGGGNDDGGLHLERRQ